MMPNPPRPRCSLPRAFPTPGAARTCALGLAAGDIPGFSWGHRAPAPRGAVLSPRDVPEIALPLFESHRLPNTPSLPVGRGNNEPPVWRVLLGRAGGPCPSAPLGQRLMAFSRGCLAPCLRPPSESSGGKAASLGSACAFPWGRASWPSTADTRTLKSFFLCRSACSGPKPPWDTHSSLPLPRGHGWRGGRSPSPLPGVLAPAAPWGFCSRAAVCWKHRLWPHAPLC